LGHRIAPLAETASAACGASQDGITEPREKDRTLPREPRRL